MNIGLVGAGAMGLAMAARLCELGHAVTVRDIDPRREVLAAAAGCAVAPTAAAAARAAEILIVAVVDGAQARSVLFGADGAVHGLAAGSTVLMCPTLAPADVEACAEGLLARGVDVLDAPMSGGPLRARAGTMSLMVAGAEAVFTRCEPLLRQLAASCFRVGSRIGDGARTKLVNNLLAAINLAGAAEAMALARRFGLDEAATLAVIEQSSGQSWIASDRLRRHLAGDPSVCARVALLAKDAALALAEAPADSMPIGAAVAAAFAAARDDGWADHDDAVMFDRAAGRPQP